MPARKAGIYYAVIQEWFVYVDKAHRNATGEYYRLDFEKLFTECEKLVNKGELSASILNDLDENRSAIQNALFLTAEMVNAPLERCFVRYLTIVDEAYFSQLNQERWSLTAADDYWGNGSTTLHERVFKLAGKTKSECIHHINYCPFDNRAGNLEAVTRVAHRTIHQQQIKTGPVITDEVEIKNTTALIKFILYVFAGKII